MTSWSKGATVGSGFSMGNGVNIPVTIAWAVNWAVLATLVLVAFLVGRDARKRGLRWPVSLAWALVSLAFPLGPVLYLLAGRK